MSDSQFTLRTLLVAIALVAVVLALSKWLGGLAAMISVLAIMFAIAARQKSLRQILSPDGMTWFGGAIMALSVFFRFSYGPWGAEVKQYEFMRNFDFSLDALGLLMIVWPAVFGATAGLMAFLGIISHHDPKISVLRWTVLSVILGAWPTAWLAFFFTFGNPSAVYMTVAFAVVLATALTILFCRTPLMKTAVIQLIGTLSTLPQLNPVSPSVPIGDIFLIYGPGYWMLVLGTATIMVSSATHLTSLPFPNPTIDSPN